MPRYQYRTVETTIKARPNVNFSLAGKMIRKNSEYAGENWSMEVLAKMIIRFKWKNLTTDELAQEVLKTGLHQEPDPAANGQ